MALTVRVLFDFDAQEGSGELCIRTGETLTVTRQDVGEGWWEGVNSRGQQGLFPESYVEVMSPGVAFVPDSIIIVGPSAALLAIK